MTPTPLSSIPCSAHLPLYFIFFFFVGGWFLEQIGVQGLLCPPAKFPPAALSPTLASQGTTSCGFGWEKIKLESFQLDLLI